MTNNLKNLDSRNLTSLYKALVGLENYQPSMFTKAMLDKKIQNLSAVEIQKLMEKFN